MRNGLVRPEGTTYYIGVYVYRDDAIWRNDESICVAMRPLATISIALCILFDDLLLRSYLLAGWLSW